MLRHLVVVTVALATALGAAQQMMKVSAARAAAAQPIAVASAATGPASEPDGPIAAQVSKSADGHYWAEAEMDGRWVHCMIDTGASYVALTRTDAQRLGIDLQALTYDVPVTTANGTAHAARVQLSYVSVAGARVEQVSAMVVNDGLSTSLLGMSYLGRLSRFEATPTALILRP